MVRAASPFFAAPQFVHAAVRDIAPDRSTLYSPAYAENGIDLCYVKDCGRAIALLQLSQRLSHRTYNVASGQITTYAELATAVKVVIPDAPIELPAGRDPSGPDHDAYLDIGRIREDAGYQPAYGATTPAGILTMIRPIRRADIGQAIKRGEPQAMAH